MIRTIVLAASALLVASAPAFAAEKGIHVSLAGKTAAEIHTDIVKAASKVCYAETSGQPLFAYIYSSCIQSSVSKAVAQINDPALIAYNETHSRSGR